MEKVTLLKTGFSTADAEYPTFVKEGGILTLRYEDWKESQIEIYFGETIAFKWQECESFLDNERDDSCYKINGSLWLAQHVSQGVVNESDGYNHYRFNFNGNGQLEVISLGFEQKT